MILYNMTQKREFFMLDIFNTYRTKDGFINLDKISDLVKMDLPTRGSRNKIWFSYLADLYLFKEEKNPFESIKEVINEELAIQFGVENASYDLAIYQEKIGVLSKDFIQEKDFIPFLFLLFQRPKISNDLVTICDILETNNIEKKQIMNIAEGLFRNHLLDIFTTQRDRNVENQGFFIDGESYFLAPRYDSAGSFLTITNRRKFNNFCNHPNKEKLLKKYKGYRTKFSLCPDTIKFNAIDVLLDLKYNFISSNSFYLESVLKKLDSEMQKIYLLNVKEVFQKLHFYNIEMDQYFKNFLVSVLHSKIEEFTRIDQEKRR